MRCCDVVRACWAVVCFQLLCGRAHSSDTPAFASQTLPVTWGSSHGPGCKKDGIHEARAWPLSESREGKDHHEALQQPFLATWYALGWLWDHDSEPDCWEWSQQKSTPLLEQRSLATSTAGWWLKGRLNCPLKSNLFELVAINYYLVYLKTPK